MPECGQALVLVPREVGLRPPPLRHHRLLSAGNHPPPLRPGHSGQMSPVQGLTELRASQNLQNLAQRRHNWRLAAAVQRTDTNPRK